MATRLTGMLASTLVVLATAGCGGGGNAVAWTDEVCGAIAGFTTAATTQPDLNSTDPVAMVRGIEEYLGSAATALDTSINRLKAAGKSPVDGGDEYVARLTDALTQIRTSFNAARTQLAAVDTSSVESVSAALPAAVAPLQELSNLEDPTAGLRDSAELRAATEQAPNCKQLRATG